jgi:hypothetical protein
MDCGKNIYENIGSKKNIKQEKRAIGRGLRGISRRRRRLAVADLRGGGVAGLCACL